MTWGSRRFLITYETHALANKFRLANGGLSNDERHDYTANYDNVLTKL